MDRSLSFPGFGTPTVGFEQPFEMLVACHERVGRTLDLLRRLIDHIDTQGHDAASRSAAQDVLRYFDLAAPLHHEDEELHVFPALAGSADPQVRAAILALQRDHERMAVLWARLRTVVETWCDDVMPQPIDASTRQGIDEFTGMYANHVATEERMIYPTARGCLDAADLVRIGAEMQARRRTG